MAAEADVAMRAYVVVSLSPAHGPRSCGPHLESRRSGVRERYHRPPLRYGAPCGQVGRRRRSDPAAPWSCRRWRRRAPRAPDEPAARPTAAGDRWRETIWCSATSVGTDSTRRMSAAAFRTGGRGRRLGRSGVDAARVAAQLRLVAIQHGHDYRGHLAPGWPCQQPRH